MNYRITLFVLISILFAYFSRNALLRPSSHGFPRFFAWEALLALILINHPFWFISPLAFHQIISWILLTISIALVIHGGYLLKILGKHDPKREEKDLFFFEKTRNLVTTGIYRYIRHPLYASLIFLGWGAFFKHFSSVSLVLVVLATLLLVKTSLQDEQECLSYFGKAYSDYMMSSKRFIPFIF